MKKTAQLIISLLWICFSELLYGQISQTVSQDIEIRTNAPDQYRVYTTSSDLELSGFDEDLSFPQTCFLRFEGVSIPANAIISEVRIDFRLKTPNSVSANSFKVYIENGSAAAYPAADVNDGVTGAAILNRSYTSFVTWASPAYNNSGTPLTVSTANLASIFPSQFIGQTSNLAFKVEGLNSAVLPMFNVYAKEYSSGIYSPQLIINYTISNGNQIVQTVNQDIEINTGTGSDANRVYATSSDLELTGLDEDLSYPQLSFLRFENIAVPANAIITEVRLDFKLKTPGTVNGNRFRVYMEANSASAYPNADVNDGTTGAAIRHRTYTQYLHWSTPAYTNNGSPITVSTPNLMKIFPSQFIGQTVNLAFKVEGTNIYNTPFFAAYSKDASSGAYAPQLVITYTFSNNNQLETTVAQDIEIRTNTPDLDRVYTTSSDLELSGFDEDLAFPQQTFLRFENVTLPANAQITEVRLDFNLKTPNTVSANSFKVYTETTSAAAYPVADVNDGVTGAAIRNRNYSSYINWTTPSYNNTGAITVSTPNLVSIFPSQFIGQTVNVAFKIEGTNSAVSPIFNAYSKEYSSGINSPKLVIAYTLTNTVFPKFMWSGALTHNSIKVNAKLSAAAADCKLVVSTASDFSSNLSESASVAIGSSTNFMGSLSLSGLQANTQYYYRIKLNGTLNNSITGKFRTAPDPTLTNKSFSFIAGACNNPPDEVYEPQEYTKYVQYWNYVNTMTSNSSSPLFYLNMGDLHYADVPYNEDYANVSNNRYEYEFYMFANDNNTERPTKAVLQNMPISYVWDDHDMFSVLWGEKICQDNSCLENITDCGNTTIQRTIAAYYPVTNSNAAAQQAYREYVPHYPLANNAAIYQAYTIGRVRFILTDLRSEQSLNEMMSESQLCWFKTECLNAKKNNQLIAWVSSIGITSTRSETDSEKDFWGISNKRGQRTAIFNWLKDAGINNLFIIAGDTHSLGIDDGSNTDCVNTPNCNDCPRDINSTNPRFPLLQVAPLFHNSLSHKEVITNVFKVREDFFDNGANEVNRGHFTYIDVVDNSGTNNITVKTTLYRYDGVLSDYTLRQPTTGGGTLENSNKTYVFERNLLNSAMVTTSASSIYVGQSVTLNATSCIGGTVTWDNGLGTGTSKTATPNITTTYTATCNFGCGAGNVTLGSVTVTVQGCPPSLVITSTTVPPYQASQYITTSGTINYSTGSILYKAGKSITITPPANGGYWQVPKGTVFEAKIEGCQ